MTETLLIYIVTAIFLIFMPFWMAHTMGKGYGSLKDPLVLVYNFAMVFSGIILIVKVFDVM